MDTSGPLDEYKRLSDELEVHMADIHEMAYTGHTLIEPMRTRKPTPYASTEELRNFARLTGNDDIHKLTIDDLCTTNFEISHHAVVEQV